MSPRFSCADCGARFKLRVRGAGRTTECPRCGSEIEIVVSAAAGEATRVDSLGIRFLNGDATVLGDLLDAHRHSLERALLTRYGAYLQHADVDDAMSIALGRLWRSRLSFDPTQGALSAWFYAIVFSVASNLWKSARARAMRVDFTDPAGLDRLPSRPDDAQQSLSLRFSADFEAVASALQSLPITHRRILLADASSPSGVAGSAELAAELGTCPSTIREYRRRARERLRRIIQEERKRGREEERKRGREDIPMHMISVTAGCK